MYVETGSNNVNSHRLDTRRFNACRLFSVWRQFPTQSEHPHAAAVSPLNFLGTVSPFLRFSVYEIEKKIKTAHKFRYPHFETINWFAAQSLYQQIGELNAEEKKCPNTLLVSLKSLMSSLKHWNTEKDVIFDVKRIAERHIASFLVQHEYERTDSLHRKFNEVNKRHREGNPPRGALSQHVKPAEAGEGVETETQETRQ